VPAQSRPVTEVDVTAIAALVGECRSYAAPEAFPGTDDVASLFAEQASREAGRCWTGDAGQVTAWAIAQTAFGNVLFDVHPGVRDRLSREVVETGVQVLSELGATSADTPLESDDVWRRDVLEQVGFEPTPDDVIHLRNDAPAAHADRSLPEGASVVSNADDLDAYVVAHRAAFGTTYLTRARRETWSDDEGYRPDLDLAITMDGAVAAFAVSYLREGVGEIGTVGVVPDRRGRRLGETVVRFALAELVARGASSATMSTSSLNHPMLRVADACGFSEHRRTSWWHREL
jgi:ribosomal protein S18 acetylase RimI-like enzyme